MTRCSVPNCNENGTHHFPKDVKVKKLWLKAIRRINFEPRSNSRLCRKHFQESDYEKFSKYTGLEHQHKFLKKTAVPSNFSWNVRPATQEAVARKERLEARNVRKSNQGDPSTSKSLQVKSDALHDEQCIPANVAIDVEVSNQVPELKESPGKTYVTVGTQTANILRICSTDLLLTDNETVHYYTGLETYNKFELVLSTLFIANGL